METNFLYEYNDDGFDIDDWNDDQLLGNDEWEEEEARTYEKTGLLGAKLEEEHFSYINVNDYNLNSPIIIDDIEEAISYQRTGHIHPRFSDKVRLRIDTLKSMNLTAAETTHYHKYWFGYLQYGVNNLDLINFFITNTVKSEWILRKIPSIYYQTVFNTQFKSTNPTDVIPTEILVWGQLYLEYHVLVLILNSVDNREITSISKGWPEFQIKVLDTHISLVTPNLGEFLIVQGNVYHMSSRVLMSREMTLNLKDMWGSRFQVLWDVCLNHEKTHGVNDWKDMNNIFITGDKGINVHGNPYYDIIKLVEAFCISKINEHATKNRPQLKVTKLFEEFIQDSLSDFTKNGYSIDLFELIDQIQNPYTLIEIFGCYRLWGHPFIEYLEGLKLLHEQVNLPKTIDDEYAKALGSDLKRIILHHKFKTEKRWFVKKETVPENHPLKQYIDEEIWPDNATIESLGDCWEDLKLETCWEIPSVIDPSILYADKSHSYSRSEVMEHLRTKPNMPIPSHRVLETLLEKEALNIQEFLTTINETGIEDEYLIIGLRAKERELKRKARFFSLMSWPLRHYFVITEYLLKKHVIPLFKGLTMADDMNSLLKKMLDNSIGHGSSNFDYITIANHLDYTKWNNHQRYESTYYVFKALGEAFGYDKLYTRTHEFFQKSWIYYGSRADLMEVYGDMIKNVDENLLVFWPGQLGGLEGLRQKGWTIVNYLVILRESRIRNTAVKILAQGDNQVICTQYKKRNTRTEGELKTEIDSILKNNEVIMNAVMKATKKLGLVINPEETLQSADLLVYGKVIVYRGMLLPIRSKRYARVLCTTNDRTPSIATTISSVVSCCLAVSYLSESPTAAIATYVRVINFVRLLIERHDPAIRCPLFNHLPPKNLIDPRYWCLLAFQDPSIGGINGVNLNRFFIRAFPDPVTESLSFWLIIWNNTLDSEIKQAASIALSPEIAPLKPSSFKQLLEDPLSLNIRHGVSSDLLIKEKIKELLQRHSRMIKNNIVRDAVEYQKDHEAGFLDFLSSIEPLFPRFLSEYYTSTFFGITSAIISLFQNSRTLKQKFSRSMSREINNIVIKSELISINTLMTNIKRQPVNLYTCSSTLADDLRKTSWGKIVYGATVPHPSEILQSPTLFPDCKFCASSPDILPYLCLLLPYGIPNEIKERGPFKAYLGSKTKESTGVLQPWEQEAQIPLIERASRLRRAIGWFVKTGSDLENSILQNIEALTGNQCKTVLEGVLRTGAALHRFSSSRQSSGGYISSSPLRASYMISTTDTLDTLGDKNYDFIYQTLILYSQQAVGEFGKSYPDFKGLFHAHIRCNTCIREVDEIWLNTRFTYRLPDVSKILSSWKPENSAWFKDKPQIPLLKYEWDQLDYKTKHIALGWVQSHIYLALQHEESETLGTEMLFPLVIRKKLNPKLFIQGLVAGLWTTAGLVILQTKTLLHNRDPVNLWKGLAMQFMNTLIHNDSLLNIIRQSHISEYILSQPVRIPITFPSNNIDLAWSLKDVLLIEMRCQQKNQHYIIPDSVPIFSDLYQSNIVLSLVVGRRVAMIISKEKLDKEDRNSLRQLKSLWKRLSNESVDDMMKFLQREPVVLIERELRHATKYLEDYQMPINIIKSSFEEQENFPVTSISIELKSEPDPSPLVDFGQLRPYRDPLISGLKQVLWSTGTHYAISSILSYFAITPRMVLCCGDNSGTISALILRKYLNSKVYFHNTITLEGAHLKGTSPSAPSAIVSLGKWSERCINLHTCWMGNNDLSDTMCWTKIKADMKPLKRRFDLWVIDINFKMDGQEDEIFKMCFQNIGELLSVGGYIILRSYLPIFHKFDKTLTQICQHFQDVYMVTTLVAPSFSSEAYLVLSVKTKESRGKGFINWTKLSLDTKNWPNRQSELNEFKRAIKLKKYNFIKGIPDNRIVNSWSRLTELFASIMKWCPQAQLLASIIHDGHNTVTFSYAVALFLFGTNELIEGYLSKYTSFHFPDTAVEKIGIWYIGWLKWLAWGSENFKINRLSQMMIEGLFPYSYSIKTDVNEIHISIHKDLHYSKHVHIDQHLNTISSLIRALSNHIQYIKGEMDRDKINQFLKTWKCRKEEDKIIDQYDIMPCLTGEPISIKNRYDPPDLPSHVPPEALVD